MAIKILIVGVQNKFALENYYHQYLLSEGAEVEIFPISDLYAQKLSVSFFNKVLNRLDVAWVYKSVNEKLKEKIRDFKPNVVWVFKGMEVLPETLNWIRPQQIKVVNYNPDHPFVFSGRGSGNKNVTRGVGLYDMHFCYHSDVLNKIEKEFGIHCEFLPFGFDISEEAFNALPQIKKINTVCFIGNPDATRISFIKSFFEAGLSVDVYGYEWDKTALKNEKNIRIFDAVLIPKYWDIVHQYRMHINIFRPHNIGSHNMRSFEIPAAGSIMLAPDSPEHRMFFENGKEAFFYTTTEEAIRLAKAILNLPENEAIEIGNNARHRSIESKYSYKERAKFALSVLKAL